jgi:hypothetical protein
LSADIVETQRCDVCGQDIPLMRYRLHERGLDGAAPECPKQDLVEIAMRERGEWDAMRSRFREVPAGMQT